ncbi:MAG: tetratricopeptide repeat protein [Paracoccaceae bacterium]|nr:tetratricopeptide repeat protein [Paracoccaceae bacterium]
MFKDPRGINLTGATCDQVRIFEEILKAYFDYRISTYPTLKELCNQAPEFPMAHILKGFLLLSMGTTGTIPGAKASADHVRVMENLTQRELLHLQALDSWILGDLRNACAIWDEVLLSEPLDILAVKLQHFSLFWLGDSIHMRATISRVTPHWDDSFYGYAQLQGMHAFALEECGDYDKAESLGREAVERDPQDLWAIHAVSHVYEMQGNLNAGIKWLNQPLGEWKDRNPFKEHLWWHTALFALEKGEFKRVLDLYDQALWPEEKSFYLDIQNTASLLARLEFFGVNVGERWKSLAIVSEEKIGDHVLCFTEPHYTMALGRTGKQNQISKQVGSLEKLQQSTNRDNSRTVETLAIPICLAIRDYYRGDYLSTVRRLMPIRYKYQPIGGSHAQRDVFNIYLIDAAIKSKQHDLASSLLSERVALHPNSFGSWLKFAELLENMGNFRMSKVARNEVNRIVTSA